MQVVMGQLVLCLLRYLYFSAVFIQMSSSITQYKERSSPSKRSQNILQRNINLNHQSNANNYTIILDEEWNISRKKSGENELPLTILNIYESFKKNITINYYETVKVKCCFNKATNSHLGLYRFDLKEHGDNYTLINAELHIYISYDSVLNSSYPSYDYLVIRMYQVLPTNLTDYEVSSNPDLHKLLNVAYISSLRQGWQIFKVKMAVEHWLNGEPNLGILITVNDKWENRIFPNFLKSIRRGIYRPFLLVYKGKTNQKNGAINKSTQRSSHISSDLDLGCKKREWLINFEEIKWNNFIIQPKVLKAGRCSGSCASITKEDTALYTYLFQNYFTLTNQKLELCCVPVNFLSVPLIFYDESDDVVIKVYDNLVVSGCECR